MGQSPPVSHTANMKYIALLLLVAGAWARPQPADEDDWSFNAIFDYIPDGDEVYDTIVESVPKPVVTVAKSVFVADEDKGDKGRDGVDKESLINKTKPHIEELSKLGRETYKELSHIFDDLDEIDNEHEQEIQEMIQALRLMFTDPSVDDFWDAMNRAQLHIYRGHEVLTEKFGQLSTIVTKFFSTLKEAGVFDYEDDTSSNSTTIAA